MGREVRVLTEADLREAVPLDLAAVAVVERAFAALASGAVVMPPIMSMAIPGGHDEVDVKSAYIPGLDGFAVKVSTGFYGNANLGLPSLNGLMTVFSAKTGLVEALLLDNGYLTDLRTAAATRHLAPERVTCAGVLGTGLQARLQLRAAHLVRPFERALVWGRDPGKARGCAADLAATLGIEVRSEADPARLVAESQLVVTTTPARAPILRADWLHPSGAARHRHGLGCAGEMRGRAAGAGAGRPLRGRPGQPVRDPGRIAQRRGGGADAGRGPCRAGRDRHRRPRGPHLARANHAVRSDRNGCPGHRHRDPCPARRRRGGGGGDGVTRPTHRYRGPRRLLHLHGQMSLGVAPAVGIEPKTN